ncbi:lipopolysaccharide kinase InaA family protein [Marinimicrobium alkaliphilum]|uniref:lipopolysaccharide kinase InaA family protein n=1 Tax=Marinimicrobium alkaliphilum TaxID=2202654 RepID=UPI000DB9CC71|nr:lipopolysaccharide kinase InaA family protein [Marinimicrobium alkaliphilum]
MSAHTHAVAPGEGGYVDFSALNDARLSAYEGNLAPAYAQTAVLDWLAQLPAQLEGQDSELIYRVRNRVYRVDDPLDPNGPGICVKAFRPPAYVRAWYYRRHGSKAQRAHDYARHLYRQGAGVAEPIAYFERWDGNHLRESYLLTRYLSDATDLYTEMTRLLREDPDAFRFIALLRFTAGAIRHMHDSGFVHNDLGAQNILMRRIGPAEWAAPVFIDLNRGRPLADVSLKERARDMSRLEIPSHFLTIFYHIYFNDGPIPAEFSRWERRYRARIRRHRASRKLRHPIRSLRQLFQPPEITISSGQPDDKEIWLWDSKSGQPSVVLEAHDRRKHRRWRDVWQILRANARRARALRRRYLALKADAYQQPVALYQRLGVCLEVDGNLEQQLGVLRQTPGLPVLVRCYFHKGEAGLAACVAAVERLYAAGHPVALGLIQSRTAVAEPERWQAFVEQTLQRLHRWVQEVEIGHAFNRVKWGLWTLEEMHSLWRGAEQWRANYPELTFLGPAVNDFEFHYYPPLLERLAPVVDAIPCHLYVDRRGRPENYQGGFSSLEKCLYGKAVADVYGRKGFYVTEINWPLQNTGEYSPLAGSYIPRDQTESDLHVDEATSAAYMVRFALIALCSGSTEKIWWWRLAHHGFGLVDDLNGWRPRPGWQALVQFHRVLASDRFIGREEREGVIWWRFEHCQVVYALTPGQCRVPSGCTRVEGMTGTTIAAAPGELLTVAGEPLYFIS